MDLFTDSMALTTVTTDHYDMEHSFLTTVIATVSLSIIIIVSLCANTLATSTILRVRLLRDNLHNHLIVNLNVVSMCITVFSMPLTLVSIFDDGRLLKRNSSLCLFNGFCSIALPVASSFTVLWIAVDRYLTVVWSKRFPPSSLRTIFMIVSTWVASCVVAILPIFEVLSEYHYMHDTHHCSPVWEMCEFYFVVFFAVYGLSIPIMVISYFFVVYHLCKKERKMQSHQSFRSRSRFSRSERSVMVPKRKRAERTTKEKSSSLVADSSHISNGVGPKKEKTLHDSGYASPPKNSMIGTDSSPSSAVVLTDAVDIFKHDNLNKNNSASTDDGTDEPRMSACARQGSVRNMIKQLEKNNNTHRSKYDSLPKARRKLRVESNELRKAASANDVLDYETNESNIYVSNGKSGSKQHLNEESCQADLLNEGEVRCDVPSKTITRANMATPPVYHCYDDDCTPEVVGFMIYEDAEPDCSPESTMLVNQVEESDYPIVPNIIIEDVLGEDRASDSDEDSTDTPNSSTHCSQNEENLSTLLQTAAVDQDLLVVPNTSCMNGELDNTSSCDGRQDDDATFRTVSVGNVSGLQFSVSIERLAAPDEQSSSHDEFKKKREGSFGSSSSIKAKSRSGTDTSKVKRGSTRRLSMRPTLTADKQVALMGGLLVLTAIICWTPYFVIHSCFFPMNIAPHWSSILTMWLGYLNAMLNPLIYSFTNRRIRSMVGTFCGKRCRVIKALMCRKGSESATIVPH
eukprot:XP_011664262.1 PREDICTED: histamine H1 receptor [Strongylocentrotus purpuratus]